MQSKNTPYDLLKPQSIPPALGELPLLILVSCFGQRHLVKGDGWPRFYSLGDGMTPKASSSLPTRPLVWVDCPQPALLEHPLSHAEPQRKLDTLSRRPGGRRLLSSLSRPLHLRTMALRVASQLLSRKSCRFAAPKVLSASELVLLR